MEKLYSNFTFPSNAAAGGETMTLNVVNSSGNNKTFSVFGDAGWKGNQPAGVSATVPESSLLQATRESAFRGFMIKGMKVRVTNPDQFAVPVIVRISSMTGKVVEYPIQLTNYQNPMAGNPNLIEIPDINIPVWGDVNISGEILANTTMTFTMKLVWMDGSKYSGYTEFKNFVDSSLDAWVAYMNRQTSNELLGRLPGGATSFLVTPKNITIPNLKNNTAPNNNNNANPKRT